MNSIYDGIQRPLEVKFLFLSRVQIFILFRYSLLARSIRLNKMCYFTRKIRCYDLWTTKLLISMLTSKVLLAICPDRPSRCNIKRMKPIFP